MTTRTDPHTDCDCLMCFIAREIEDRRQKQREEIKSWLPTLFHFLDSGMPPKKALERISFEITGRDPENSDAQEACAKFVHELAKACRCPVSRDFVSGWVMGYSTARQEMMG
jgi:hypothetical protein